MLFLSNFSCSAQGVEEGKKYWIKDMEWYIGTVSFVPFLLGCFFFFFIIFFMREVILSQRDFFLFFSLLSFHRGSRKGLCCRCQYVEARLLAVGDQPVKHSICGCAEGPHCEGIPGQHCSGRPH